MDPGIMIVLAVGLSCDGDTARLCRVVVDPAASRGVPALSSASVVLPAGESRSRNVLREERRGEGASAGEAAARPRQAEPR
ncbi:MAG: hypothetical protein KJ015_36190 [Myxococcales bacterium]|nr:hypothetical protein [Sorangiineae bacterium PRO1]MCL4755646.1 hypothetical protein [Myxococcales bacterium]